MRTSMTAWIAGVVITLLLFVVGPLAGFNRASPPILGMPPLYFWFVFASVLEPVVIGIVYWVDRAAREPGMDEG